MALEENSKVIVKKFILTEREIEYMSLVALGCKKRKSAQILAVEPCTVKKTLEKIYKKICAEDRANAVAKCFMHGLLTNEIIF